MAGTSAWLIPVARRILEGPCPVAPRPRAVAVPSVIADGPGGFFAFAMLMLRAGMAWGRGDATMDFPAPKQGPSSRRKGLQTWVCSAGHHVDLEKRKIASDRPQATGQWGILHARAHLRSSAASSCRRAKPRLAHSAQGVPVPANWCPRGADLRPQPPGSVVPPYPAWAREVRASPAPRVFPQDESRTRRRNWPSSKVPIANSRHEENTSTPTIWLINHPQMGVGDSRLD